MKNTLRAAAAAALAAGLALAALAAPAHAGGFTEVGDGERIAGGAAVQGTFTVSCTEGDTVFVFASITQRVSEGRIASGSDFEQFTCAGGTAELTYDVVALEMAFEEGEAVFTGFIQECRLDTCDAGSNFPLEVIKLSD